jgi:hypothetical protein
MNLQFKKRDDFNFEKVGALIIYDGRVYISEEIEREKISFDVLQTEVVKKSKKSLTDVCREGVQLLYAQVDGTAFICENRKTDLFKFIGKSAENFDLLKKAF